MNRIYELVVILDPEVKAEEQEKLLTKIKKFVTDAEGKVTETKEWGKKDLCYLISKKREGIFFVLTFTSPAEKINSLKQKFTLEDGIMRFLLVTKEEEKKPKKEKTK